MATANLANRAASISATAIGTFVVMPPKLARLWTLPSQWGFFTFREMDAARNHQPVAACYNLPSLIANPLNSNTLPKMAAVLVGGTGKFTFLLQVIDTAGNQLYDIQRAWIDNEPVQDRVQRRSVKHTTV